MVGANIVALRTQRGLTQEALALRSGISRNVLIDVEHGRRDCSTNDFSISLRRWRCPWRHCCRNSAAPADDDAARRATG